MGRSLTVVSWNSFLIPFPVEYTFQQSFIFLMFPLTKSKFLYIRLIFFGQHLKQNIHKPEYLFRKPNSMNVEKRISCIRQNLERGGYDTTIAAKECITLIEHALRQLFRSNLTKLREQDRIKVQDTEKKIGNGRGIESFTMGELVGLFHESKFLDAWSRASGKELDNIRTINLAEITKLRNKLVHSGKEASRSDADLLFYCLRMILETFGIEKFEEKYISSPESASLDESFEYSNNIIQPAPQTGKSAGIAGKSIGIGAAAGLLVVLIGIFVYTLVLPGKPDAGKPVIVPDAPAKSDQQPTGEISPPQIVTTTTMLSETPVKPHETAPANATKPQYPRTAIAIMVSGSDTNSSSWGNQLYNLLRQKHGNLVLKKFSPQSLQNAFNGDTSQIKNSDSSNLILGQINTFFSQKSTLDQTLISCDLTFAFRMLDASGNTINADSYRIVGAGFSESGAAKNAMEKLVQSHADEIFASAL